MKDNNQFKNKKKARTAKKLNCMSQTTKEFLKKELTFIQTAPQHSNMGCPALVNTKGSIPYNVTGVLRQRNMAQMKEQIKAPKIDLSDEETANLSDAEFKTLVIRMITEMIEYGHKIEEEVKPMQSEIKENIWGTNSDGKDTVTQINNLEQKEEINIQPEQNEEIRIQKEK